MSINNPNTYKITYSNHFEFNNRLLAFRKQLLFDITDSPRYIALNENAKCWLVNRVQLSKQKAESLIIKKPIIVDVSNLQWYLQCELDACFNL